MTRAAKAGDRVTSSIELTRRIGAGGMGTVWVAKHHALRKDVVVKLMAEGMLDSDELRRRFTQEAASGANVKSPHVVQVFDTGVSDDFGPYIVMELLEGEDLGARLTRDEKLPPSDVARIVTQVANALDRAHAIDLVHRDVKPANIFLCKGEKDEAAFSCKVLDFGVARWRDGAMPVTETGVSLGTVTYMSPEQAAGRDDLDGTSDLYALGLVAFRALTGAPAFSRASFDSLGLGVYNLPVPKITERTPSLPAAVDDWFARACAREPSKRFRDGATMASELSTALGIGGGAGIISVPNEPTAITEGPMSGGPTLARAPVVEREPTAPGTDAGLTQPTSPGEIPERATSSRRPLFLGLAAIVAVGAIVAATRSPATNVTTQPSATPAPSASAVTDGDSVPIGVLLDLSGERRKMGEALLAATVAAQTRINQSGGVRGRPLRLVVKDDQGDTGAFLTEAAKTLVQTKGLKVILGPSTSAQVKIVAPMAQRAGILEITGSATSPSLTSLQRAEDRLLFRTVPSQTMQAKTLARVMRGEGDASKQCATVAFVAREDLEGRPFTEVLSRALTDAGARVVETRFVEAEARADYAEEVRAVAKSKAECLVLSVSPKAAARYLRQASAGDHPASTFAVSTLATDDFLVYARDDARNPSSKTVAEGVRGVRPATRPTWRPEYVELTHLLEQVDGGAPAIGEPFVPNQFDAAMFAAMTLESAGLDADAAGLRKAFHGIAGGGTVYGPQELPQLMAALRRGAAVDYVGASGDVEVDPNGDVEGDLVMWKVEHGAIAETGRIEP